MTTDSPATSPIRFGPRALYAVAGLGASLALIWWVYEISLRGALNRLSATGEIRIEQAVNRLVDQLERFRILANLLARDARVKGALEAGPSEEIDRFLRDHVLTYGAETIALLNRGGSVIAASEPVEAAAAGAGARLAAAALNGRLGLDHVLAEGTRRFRFSRGVFLDQAPPSGLVVVSADIAALEFEWSVSPEAIAFFDEAGVVFSANRPSLLLRQDRQIGENLTFDGFPERRIARDGPHRLWRFDGARDLPEEALLIRRDAPLIEMTAIGFLDSAPARAEARQQALLAAALCVALGLAAALILVWRARITDRLGVEAAANAKLEARVEARSQELKATQDQLVQATKMTALGQMSAGIAHELNQPLAAIMNFAENGKTFLDRGRVGEARDNLGLISGQIERITRIIRHLRGFARAEEETAEPVDLAAIAETALTLLEAPLTQSGATLRRAGLSRAIWVQGGEVRLQQVIVNLVSNALDAMAETEAPALHITLSEQAAEAVLEVRDFGPGITDPSRVFEPFFTTKDLGASKGLGLGLSISFGIVVGFGGRIEAANHPDGGAVFTVFLPLMAMERAA